MLESIDDQVRPPVDGHDDVVGESAAGPAVAAPEEVFTVALFPAVARAVHALTVLGVPDLLGAGPRPVRELADACDAAAVPLRQALRAAATTGLFRSAPGDVYALTDSGHSLRSDHPSHARDVLLTLAGPAFHQSLAVFADTLRSGKPGSELRTGRSIFEHLAQSADEYESFSRMMIAFHGDEPESIARGYDFATGGRVVDCGGGIGTLLRAVLTEHDHLLGTLFDTPQVIDQAGGLGVPSTLQDRWESTSGDFFEAVPSGADFYLLSHILHDWDDEHAVAILRRCREAAPSGARILVIEEIVPDGDDPSRVKMLDVVLASLFGGIERTRSEYGQLFRDAGLRPGVIVPTESRVSVIEAYVR